jgi:hypothetical protein
MTTIKAIVRGGRLETTEPINLPDGTELTIPIPSQPATLGMRDEDLSDSPEAIEAWIRWYDSLEPLDFTPQERAAWAAARQQDKELELAQWNEQSKRIEELFP